MQSILVVAPAWIGDIIIAQPLLISLKEQHPDTAIDVVAPAWAQALLARVPQVREAITYPAEHGELRLGAQYRLGRELRERDYAQALVLRNNLKSALIPWFARIPRRTGYRGEWRYGLINDIRHIDPVVQDQRVKEYVALGRPTDSALPEPMPLPRLQVDQDRRDALLRDHDLAPAGAAALCPGAAHGPAKRWPVRHFAQLAKRLVEQGRQVWVLGGPNDRAHGREIAEIAGEGVRDLCGRTSLVDALDLLSAADVVVGNDSGLTHIAAAVGPRVIGLYGPTHPNYAPPLSERARTLWLGLSCSPCHERTCPLGHGHCLGRIDVASVLQACNDDE